MKPPLAPERQVVWRTTEMSILRNLLVVCGAYYVAIWLYLPLAWLWAFVSSRMSFTVGVETMLLMPLVMGLPMAVVAFAAGALVARTIEDRYPSRWALIPALLFLQHHLLGGRWWAEPPTLTDHIGIAVEAAFPAVACVLGAVVVEGRRLRTPPNRAPETAAASEST
jgi:hypothetical protein